MTRPRPAPYSRHVTDPTGDLVVFAGVGAWDRGKAVRETAEAGRTRWLGGLYDGPSAWSARSVVCPPDQDPASMTWPARGRTVLLVREGDCATAHEMKLAASLLRDGAVRVTAIGGPGGVNVYG